MPAATIIFTDIVGFSLESENRQKELMDVMTSDVLHEVRDLLVPPGRVPEAIALPTGDGMAVTFIEGEDPENKFKRILRLAARLLQFAKRESVLLRIGIHFGPVEFIRDINGKDNICGDAINFAQRVMDAANDNQLLISESTFRKYVGQSPGKVVISNRNCPDCQIIFSDAYDVLAKHKRRIVVHIAEITYDEKLLSVPIDELPLSKDQTVLSNFPLGKPITGGQQAFGNKLNKAIQVALIQATGENLLPLLIDKEVKLNSELERLWVAMPFPECFDAQSSPPLPDLKTLKCHVEAWRVYLSELAVEIPHADIKIALFSKLPFFGASFLDWDRAEGAVHVSPYVWGLHAKECPGFDLAWEGYKRPSVAGAYIQGLQNLLADAEYLDLKK